MRKSLVLATFAVAGAGAAGLGAIALNGSDTLGDLTHDLVGPVVHTSTYASPVCAANGYTNASSIVYNGGGSGLGETNMGKGLQQVAPMSRFLKKGSGNNVCATDAGAGTPQTANGIVIALDGVTLVTSQLNAGSVACNGPAADTDCNPNAAELAVGLAYNTTVPAALRTAINPAITSSYTFDSWTDVLKVLYFGKIDPTLHGASPAAQPADPEGPANGVQNCNSTLRQALANNWGTIFENNCASGNCTQIRHLFRRDDGSGTSDIFSSLLGFGGPNVTGTPINTAAGTWALGADNFCNDLVNQAGQGASEWPGSLPVLGANGVVPNDLQDYDPIRRPCVGFGTNKTVNNATEQVCERGTYNPSSQTWSAASLGLLLPLADDTLAPAVVSNLGGPAVKTQFNIVSDTNGDHVNRCTGGVVSVSPPALVKLTGAGAGTKAVNGYCPNGDVGSNGFCLVPADNNGNPNCMSFSADTPPLSTVCTTQGTSANNYGNSSPGAVCDATAGSLNPQAVDPRVFNLYAWTWNGSAWVNTSDNAGRPIWGAFKRIHTSQAMYASPSNTTAIDNNAPGGPTPSPLCNKLDATDQIGCLVQASPCSLGFAGRGSETATGPNPGTSALTMTTNNTGLKILGVPDNAACIQNFSYRYSRKLYLNTMLGFGGASAPELDLAKCESNPAVISGVAITNGFVPLPDAGTWGALVNGKPFCEDFNESANCIAPDSGAGNVNACANNDSIGGGGLIPGASNSTLCGNGVVEQFEDCDNGPSNGSAASGATCSLTCRFNF
jgi:hypothetical protein